MGIIEGGNSKRPILKCLEPIVEKIQEGLPTRFEQALGFYKDLNPASCMPFNLSFHPNEWFHLKGSRKKKGNMHTIIQI